LHKHTRDSSFEQFFLSDIEVETLRRAAIETGLPFDKDRRTYTRSELARYGMVRESYTRDELRRLGFRPEPVSCFDASAKSAEDLLRIDTPFGREIKKWQLPIGSSHIKIEQTVFPPNTLVAPHVHPENSQEDPGGGLRIVISGTIFYEGREYGPGDWFFAPNGRPYTFTTDRNDPTIVMYSYHFFGIEQENRFSHPSAAERPEDSDSQREVLDEALLTMD
jgi:hypothetical protein